MKYLWGPHSRDVWIWVSTVFILISLKDRNCEIGQRSKITRAPCRRRKGEAVPRADNFGDLKKKQITRFSVNIVNPETITDMQSWYRTWPLNGSRRIRAKTKTSQETQRSLQKFLEPDKKPKVIYTDNSLEFGKTCEDLSWNHCASTPHRSETNGIAESSAQSKGRHLCCIVAIRSERKLVGRFHGMLHLSAQRHRSII